MSMSWQKEKDPGVGRKHTHVLSHILSMKASHLAKPNVLRGCVVISQEGKHLGTQCQPAVS